MNVVRTARALSSKTTKDMDLERIYTEFREPLKAFIVKRTDEALAEDLVHEVFLKIHHQIGSLQEREKLASWIYTIARNTIIDFYRKKKEPVTVMLEETPDEHEPPAPASETLTPMVRRMIEQLPEKYKKALVLADLEGLKQADIAKELGVSLSGAKSRVQRARSMLKEILLQCCHFEFDRYGTVFDYYPKKCTACCPADQKKCT